METSTDSMSIPGVKLSLEEQFIINSLRLKLDRDTKDDICTDKISDIDLKAVYNKSVEWCVAPLLYSSIKKKLRKGLFKNTCDQSVQEMKLAYISTLLLNKHKFIKLIELLKAFNSEGIEAVLLKGIFLAHFVYSDPGLRPMSDIDILVKPEHLKKVEELMFKMGYHYNDPSKIKYKFFKDHYDISDLDGIICWYKSKHHHLLPFTSHNKIESLEIHGAIVGPDSPFPIDVSELWRRSTIIKIPGLHALAFSPEDLLLHLALQSSYSHRLSHGLRPYCDTAVIINHYSQKIDWKNLQFRARKWGIEKYIYLTLRLSHDFFGIKMPEMVLDRLKHPFFDENIARQAKLRILHPEPIDKGMRFPARIHIFRSDEKVIKKIYYFGHCLKKVFIPSKELAERYSIPYPSKRVYFYYFVRLTSLLRCYGKVYISYFMNILIYKKKSANLESWLAKP